MGSSSRRQAGVFPESMRAAVGQGIPTSLMPLETCDSAVVKIDAMSVPVAAQKKG
jgi:hypothetical protein